MSLIVLGLCHKPNLLSLPLGNEICQWLFLDHLPISEGGWILVHLNHMGQSEKKSSFLEEDLILLIAK